MPFITQGNTNWKFIGIVAVLAVIVGGVILLYPKTQEPPQQVTVRKLRELSGLSHGLERVDILFKLEGTIKKEGAFCDYSFVDTTGSICINGRIKNIDSYIDKSIIVEGYYYGYSLTADPQEFFEIKKIKTTEKDETADWQTYRNEKYNYEFRYPENYRIANSIMEKKALEDEAIKEKYREEYSVEDLVVVTSLLIEEEQEYLEICGDFLGGCYASSNFPSGTISLVPFFTADWDIEAQIREQKLYETNGSELSNFRIEKTIFGLEVRRWKTAWAGEYEAASITLPEKVLYPPIYYGYIDYQYLDDIRISMKIGDDYEEDLLVLDRVISSFRFLE